MDPNVGLYIHDSSVGDECISLPVLFMAWIQFPAMTE